MSLVTPEDYEPPGFQATSDEDFVFKDETTNIKVGDVLTVSVNHFYQFLVILYSPSPPPTHTHLSIYLSYILIHTHTHTHIHSAIPYVSCQLSLKITGANSCKSH